VGVKRVFSRKFAAEGGFSSLGGESILMDAEILAARLEANEKAVLSIDGRLDAICEEVKECLERLNSNQEVQDLTARLAVLEAERANLAEQARIAEAEAVEAQAEAAEAEAEAVEALVEAAEAEAEEEEETPSLEVIEAPEETENSPSSQGSTPKTRSDWETLGLNL